MSGRHIIKRMVSSMAFRIMQLISGFAKTHMKYSSVYTDLLTMKKQSMCLGQKVKVSILPYGKLFQKLNLKV